MLELRPVCEHCNKQLPPQSTEAMICSYECTFCADCVANVFENVCPNCGGGFVPRPARPKEKLQKDPPTSKITFKPVDMTAYAPLQSRYKHIPAHER